ncbi:CocE/NonD family hydrolase [Paraburkholderia sabiae]|uniref:CocE/NonD family hydrolase n=1 Tax=Paraburkholderia sabiae TaxID=273251 RepID=A0ABU9QHW9_9BURK|nr:CocE/NonD family hydrolase [Paraburkholderia sabiae]WJZ77409.1 CocE/NonD family hydrolase [Paraburkholderia sabiae]CAD6557700.1 Cocaine esterase [Paraburkholderia sabiae]
MVYAVQREEGMVVERDVAITMDDGIVLRADVFRPDRDGCYPVLMTYGPYAKGLHFEDGFPFQWNMLTKNHPEVMRDTSSRHANWETVDPERWVPHGYVCIRVDSRGSGQSPGFVDPFSERETKDYFDCIEWAGVQPWSSGKVGLLGVSYFAQNQWQVAALRPPHLAAICPFEGAADLYRDAIRHGGILSTFQLQWYPRQVESVQYGLGENGPRSRVTGQPVAGDETFDAETLRANRTDLEHDQLSHPLLDEWFERRVPDLSRIEVPLLSCGNWGGQGLHLRGNVEGFVRAGSQQKWLEMHGLEHWTEFYTDYGVSLQKRFFDHFLKGAENGWDLQPQLQLQLRTTTGFIQRHEHEWPLARTQWTKHYLDAAAFTLEDQVRSEESNTSFVAMRDVVTFNAAPCDTETEITGPLAATLYVSSTTEDMDLFLTLRLFDPEGKEVLFAAAVEPNAPVTQGWLRASHRELDLEKSTPWRPWRAHKSTEPIVPGQVYELAIELWPTSIIVPAGHRLALTVAGHDFDHGLPEPMPQIYGRSQRGSSVFLHNHDEDRPSALFGGTTKIYTGTQYPSHLLLPVIRG